MSTPATVSQDSHRSRLPDPTQLFPELAAIAGGMHKATRNGSIPPATISLVQLRAGQIAGSTYHTVRQAGDLREAGETDERITAVASWRDAGSRSWAQPRTRPGPGSRRPPETWSWTFKTPDARHGS